MLQQRLRLLLAICWTRSKLFVWYEYSCANHLSRSITPWKPDESDELAEASEVKGKKKTEKKLSDSTVLKGVLWPGMDLFDSATPEMKRMRNQRKDESVLEQMIATSNDVEPNEVVYDLNGEIHHTRDIFGPLSTENSPVSERPPSMIPTLVLIS